MLDTKIDKEEKLEKENINKLEDSKNENDAKLEFLKNFDTKESRDKIINSLEHKIAPELFRIVSLAQRMIREFIEEAYGKVPEEKLEILNIIFNSISIEFSNLKEDCNIIIDYENRKVFISEKRRSSQAKLLGYIIYAYAHCLIKNDNEQVTNKSLAEGNADVFTDLVINTYIQKHPFENLGFHVSKNYSIETAYTEENSIIRTRMYVLEKLNIDKKMLMEYLIGNKEKYLRNIFNGDENKKFNLNEFYEKNKFALENIDTKSLYYRNNNILPILKLQEKIKNFNILEKEYNSSEIIKIYFNYEKLNKINADELDEILNIIKDTNKIENNSEEFINNELLQLTDMEKRMFSANILANILVVFKYGKLSEASQKELLEIIKYLINDLERNVKTLRCDELIKRIEETEEKINLENKKLEDEIKDSLSYLRIKLKMSKENSVSPEIFFSRLQMSLKSTTKIERNEELVAYQTIKEELNISKK